jgi:hypothetical protein
VNARSAALLVLRTGRQRQRSEYEDSGAQCQYELLHKTGRAWSKRMEGGDVRAAAFAGPAVRYAPSKIASGSNAETT